MTPSQENGETREIVFGKAYEGIIDCALTGFSSLLLTVPVTPASPLFAERRSGGDRRRGDRRSGSELS